MTVIFFTASDKITTVTKIYHENDFPTKALPSLFPIVVVLITHFTSSHSVNHIFKMIWQKEEDEVQLSESDNQE